MKVCIIGSGGREYAIATKLLADNPDITLDVIPGNDAMTFARIHPEIAATDILAIVDFCVRNDIDLCVVAPDDPLVLGLVDALEDAGISCFGPRQSGAMLEGSKRFAKEFMVKHGIPTAGYAQFSDVESARDYVRNASYPLVIKADGLALGKGVVIVSDLAQAEEVLQNFMVDLKFGTNSASVIIEEFLTGPEISVLAFCDGTTIKPMTSSMDHKKIFDADRGPNTGGMGCIAPNPVFTSEIESEFERTIMYPTLEGMIADGLDFRGCLYFGLMLTDKGLAVIEYNARFGDPETQVVLPLLTSNLLDIFMATSAGRLAEVDVEFSENCATCVVMACEGYPDNPIKGNVISYDPDVEPYLVFAGVKRNQDGELESSSGRVLNVLGFGATLGDAINSAYHHVGKVSFAHSHYRTDIGTKAREIEAQHDL
ncbi:phosphoribosylamine--glycine ligase [Arcanobacterium pinnipediorum]|uniref:Phosphoribosylamine--glycine ligase n=1 Tax=Arcanobacterium pinnipediorum TaxID=1503041 RepID=A0ABY5AJG9_9ACTO|nr:phosphoribosylamine--glycine ligase [Arcanobacterium pinnipediorum]USR80140.1 phosphoribosylamine--glycine ligase [Arcanobacterium pinnipediorum]